MLSNKVKVAIGFSLTPVLLNVSSLSSLAQVKQTAPVVVKNYTGEDILNVRVNHKYSNVYKNPLLWEGILENGATTNPQPVTYNVGGLTTGKDWWSIMWTQPDEDKVYYSNPNNFRGFVDTIETIGQIALPIGAAAVAGVLGAACDGISAGICTPFSLAGVYTAIAGATAISEVMMNSESTVGFKQHFLTPEDAGKTVTISLYKDNKIVIKSESGTSETVYTSGKPDVSADTQEYYQQLAAKHIEKRNNSTASVGSQQNKNYRVEIDCYYRGLDNTDTKNRITVQFWAGSERFYSHYQDGISDCGALSRDPSFKATSKKNLTHIVVKTNGKDAFFIDELRIFEDDEEIGWHGRDQGKGWCLSTDPTDNTRSWKGYANSCDERRKFTANTK